MQDKLVRDTINIKICENLKNLLNTRKTFDIIEIFILSDEVLDFNII